MAESILKQVDQVMPYVDQVRRLADSHQDEFGFLHEPVYVESAERGNLWIVIDKASRDFRGYLLLGGRHPRMKVFQAFVHPDHRSSGIGKRLISELIKYSTERGYLNITARVLSQLEANRFWKKVGFHIIKQKPGTRGTINIYSLNLDVPSLFGDESDQPSSDQATIQIDPRRPLLQTLTYVIDLNVYFDAVRNRDSGQSSKIIASALRKEILLYVTSEFATELERASQDLENDPILAFAKGLPSLPQVRLDQLQTAIADLKNLLSSTTHHLRQWTRNDESDLTHLASSIHHRASGFITSDAAILRNAKRIYKRFGLQVVSPSDLVDSFEPDGSANQTPISVLSVNREIQVSNLNDQNRTSVDRFLLHHDLGKLPLLSWPGTIPGSACPEPLVVSASDQIIGIGLWSGTRRPSANLVLHLVVDEDHPDSDLAIDRILAFSANVEDVGRVWRFNLKILRSHIRTRETLLRRGFHPQVNIDDGAEIEFTRVVTNGPVTSNVWPIMEKVFLDKTGLRLPPAMPTYQELKNTGIVLSRDGTRRPWTMTLFDFETFLSPGLIIAPHRDAVIVPIRERYADELLPEARDQGLLLSQHDAEFRLERAYFLTAGRHNILPRGKLVVFYVSAPRSQAVALSRVTFSDTLTTTQAMLLIRQGVLKESELRQRANDRNQITVFTFDNILRFSQNIDFSRLKDLGCVRDANLVTAQNISDVELGHIVREGFGASAG